MNSINPINLISVAAFAAVVLMILGWRILAHHREDKNNSARNKSRTRASALPLGMQALSTEAAYRQT